MDGILTGTEPTEATSSSKSKGDGSSRHPYAGDSSSANQTRSASVGTAIAEEPELVEETADSAEGDVSGYVMENLEEKSSAPSLSGAPLVGIILVLFILLAIGAGFRRGN
jgi:cobalamin biosynthesis Mg chelatase CobN